jgi:predicted phosphodiesterase
MFGFLILASYSAYKHFSGLDPLKLDPSSVVNNLTNFDEFPNFLNTLLASFKIRGVPQKADNPFGEVIKGLNNAGDNTFQSDQGEELLTFIVVADSHIDNIDLKRALTQAKNDYPKAEFIIGLGDYSDVGTIQELSEAKKVLDATGLRYFLTAGDHDLWQSRDQNLPPESNFNKVFGPPFQTFIVRGVKIIIIHNSDNYHGIDSKQMDWISRQLSLGQDEGDRILVFLHEPLYHPSSDHFMGRLDPKLRDQAKYLIQLFSKYGVKKVFAGDAHYFSEYIEPESSLPMVTLGAVTAERNPQAPRFAIVNVFANGSTEVKDIEIK